MPLFDWKRWKTPLSILFLIVNGALKDAVDTFLISTVDSFTQIKHRLKGIVVQGEIAGPGIQKNIYGLSTYRFFVYTLRHLDGSRILSLDESLAFAKESGLEFVPVLSRNEKVSALDELLKSSEGASRITEGVPREGTVWVSESTGVHFKVKSRPYKVWFEDRKAK